MSAVFAPLVAMLLLGLLSSVQCGAMCGGIVSAFSIVQPKDVLLKRQILFNAGRLSPEGALGMLAFGVYGLAQAGSVAEGMRRGILCF